MSRNKKNNGSDLISPALYTRELYQWKWRTHIEALVMSRCKWNNLPETVNERFLERVLMTKGKAVFYNNAGLYMATMVTTNGPGNVVDEYPSFISIGNNGHYEELTDDNGVLIWDSMTRKPKYDIIELFAQELAEIDEQARTNRRQQKSVTVFSGPEENSGDLVRMARALEMNETNVIAVKKITDDAKVSAVTTGIQYLQKEFHADRIATLNNLYSFLGIEHIPFEKSERLLSVEAGIATDAVARMREDALLPRQIAAKAINDMFDLNISVEWRSSQYDEIVNEGITEPGKENKDG